jgi:uncharacterized protein YbjT (DUF2867 family)
VNVLILGATGMIGRGVLRECLLDAGIERVTTLGRRATGQQHPKLREIVHENLFDLSAIESPLADTDACFFCLGVSAIGMTEADYTAVTHDLTLSVAATLVRVAPSSTFVYVSGASTESTERGRTMWARVKGRTENDLLRLPFKAAYMFRPGLIFPLHGIRSKTRWYQMVYTLLAPLRPVVLALFPGSVTTTEQVGRAMLTVARHGYPTRILETRDITAL